MAATTPSKMPKCVMVAIKTSEDEISVFDIIFWKSRSERVFDSKGSCGCTVNRLRGDCGHTQIVNAPITKLADCSDESKWTTIFKFDWAKGAPYEAVIVGIREENSQDWNFACVDRSIGDVSALDMISRLVLDSKTLGNGTLDPKRIYTELHRSYKGQKSLADIKTSTAAPAAAPLPKAGLPSTKAKKSKASPSKSKTQAQINKDLAKQLDETLKTLDTSEKPEVQPESNKAEKVKPEWATIPRPDPSAFFVSEENWTELMFSICNGENAILVGPSGSGKSELVAVATAAANAALCALDIGSMHEPRTSLIGSTHLNEEGTIFSESPFCNGYRGGPKGEDRVVVLMDEITRDRFGASNILLPAMDRQRRLRLDEKMGSPVIKRGKNVSMIATANIGMVYTQTETMDEAMKQRFATIIRLDWPEKSVEVKILRGRYPVSQRDAEMLVNIAGEQRKMSRGAEAVFETEISTRQLLAAANRISQGYDPSAAVKLCIVNTFSEDGGDESEVAAIRQIVQKVAPHLQLR